MNIEEKLYEFLKKRFIEQQELEKSNIKDKGGKLRAFSGETVEKFVDLTVQLISNEKNVNLTSKVGKTDEITITDDKGNSIKESVDRHIYLDDNFLLAVECKTYLDKCYLQRADGDFSLMRLNGDEFKTCVLSLEDSIDETALKFFMNRGNVDKTIFLFNGKRNSNVNKRIYHTYENRKNIEALNCWVKCVEDLIDEKRKIN